MGDYDSTAVNEAMTRIREKYDNPAAQAVLDEINVHRMIVRMEGRDGGLRPSKPTAEGDDGLTQYVWRMARFHSNANDEMPVTANWWLKDWVNEHGIDASVSGIIDESGKAVTSAIGDVVNVILVARFGHDPTAGAQRYERAGII